MIGEIQINSVATYQSPATLGDLRRINFIFGANGTSKTAISYVVLGCDLSGRVVLSFAVDQ